MKPDSTIPAAHPCTRHWRGRIRTGIAAACLAFAGASVSTVQAAQVDIAGPAGSTWFGFAVAVLPNGNFVVTDPRFSIASAQHVGAVHLFAPTGALLGSLTGSTADDHVGSGGVVVLDGGQFVISSPNWDHGPIMDAGAATWADGNTGIPGVVAASNSLVGTHAADAIGSGGVAALANGNYVVASPAWSDGTSLHVGAVTWGDGTSGLAGAVAPGNSLVGSSTGDVGNAHALANGHYVVESSWWDNGTAVNAGAVTWGDGNSGTTGTIGADNSLVGTTVNDHVGTVVTFANGDYVVASGRWDNGAAVDAGAVTRCHGLGGTHGPVSPANSLTGSTTGDRIGLGYPYPGVVALANGHYVVASPTWSNGTAQSAGAVTWASSSGGIAGAVSPANSLVGTKQGDMVGMRVAALASGHYVVGSPYWDNADIVNAGAATWADGSSGLHGPVTATHSLTGTMTGDQVGEEVAALGNGHYVVASYLWHDLTGAVTWADGHHGLTGNVSTGNSLVGAAPGDCVGCNESPLVATITPLRNGNYVVVSADWRDPGGNATSVGAVTWVDGSGPATGVVSTDNSLVGSSKGDQVGHDGVVAVGAGNYVVVSPDWDNGTSADAGAVTWGNGLGGVSGTISAHNSLVGSTTDDRVGDSGRAGIRALVDLGDDHHVIHSGSWNNGAGAITLARSSFRLAGTIQAYNSVRAGAAAGFPDLSHAYDAARSMLVVGRPAENIVSLFTIDQVFASGWE